MHPERLQHIYFNNVLLLRALSRIGPYLSAYTLDDRDGRTNDLFNNVLKIAKSAGVFDETSLFQGNDAKVSLGCSLTMRKPNYGNIRSSRRSLRIISAMCPGLWTAWDAISVSSGERFR